jgi:hypothetical protein
VRGVWQVLGTRVAFIVPTPVHDVGPCHAWLMAGATGQARGTVVPNLHPEAVHPTVAHLIPVWLDNAPVGRALTEDTCHWRGRCCRWGCGGGLGPHAGTVPEYGGGCLGGIIRAIAICMSANACISCAFVATRLSMVKFFCMDALARLSSVKAI